jgi:hypothetical protein
MVSGVALILMEVKACLICAYRVGYIRRYTPPAKLPFVRLRPFPKKRGEPLKHLSDREALEKQIVVRTRSAPLSASKVQYIAANPLKQEPWHI